MIKDTEKKDSTKIENKKINTKRFYGKFISNIFNTMSNF